MRSTTRRALDGVTRTYRAWALTCIGLCSSLVCSADARAALLGAVDAEGPGRGELAELVPDHRLGDVDGHVLAAVVDGDGVPHHVRDDGAAARPGADDPLVTLAVELVDLLQQVVVDER